MQLIAPRSNQTGLSLIELMVAITVLGILIVMGFPSYTQWIQNSRIRAAAESIVSGLNLARTEAIRRNTTIRFDLVNSLTSSCALSTSGTSWVVARGSPAGACGVAPAAATDTSAATTSDPKIVQKWTSAEAAQGITVAATGGTSIVFNGLGRVSGASPITRIVVNHSTGTASDHRRLEVRATSGGLIRMCDPQVSDTSDPRACP